MSDNSNRPSVAVMGLGQLGTRLAEAFLGAGYPTTVWNRTPVKADALVAHGAVRAGGVADAVDAGSPLVVCLPDYDTVRELLEPVAARLRGRVVVNLTSGTPEQARWMAEWIGGHGGEYLDGAAMSGTRLVGDPEALFLFGGASEVFTAHRPVLRSLGNAVHVGADPALVSVYDTGLFGLAWGTLAGFYHAVALAGAADVDPEVLAAVAAEHMPFVTSLMIDHARQIASGTYPDDDGTVDVHAAAIEHLIHASTSHGLRADVPELVGLLLERAVADGHGTHGIASVAQTLRA